MTDREAALCWESNADTWTTLARQGYDVYRDLISSPAFFEMLPLVEGLRGLDLGCGEGSNTRALARRGAHVWAIDVSPTLPISCCFAAASALDYSSGRASTGSIRMARRAGIQLAARDTASNRAAAAISVGWGVR